MNSDWTSWDAKCPSWHTQDMPPDGGLANSASETVKIYTWVGEEFGTLIDDGPSRPKHKVEDVEEVLHTKWDSQRQDCSIWSDRYMDMVGIPDHVSAQPHVPPLVVMLLLEYPHHLPGNAFSAPLVVCQVMLPQVRGCLPAEHSMVNLSHC